MVNWIMLNPSTADANKDDPTIRRCIAFSKAWGFKRLTVTNLFAFRATSPKDLFRAIKPVGPANDEYLTGTANVADQIVYAWGSQGDFRGRGDEVRHRMRDVIGKPEIVCLGCTKSGQPRHPLYVPATQERVKW